MAKAALLTAVIIVIAAPAVHADPLDDILAEIRYCESDNIYTIVSNNGLYHGAYQFDLPTWYAVGGEGDPEDAPPGEQDYRARLLLSERGRTPWPNC